MHGPVHHKEVRPIGFRRMDARRKPDALDLVRGCALQHLLRRRNDRHRLRRQQHEIGMASNGHRDRILEQSPFLHDRGSAEAEHGGIATEGAVFPGLSGEGCCYCTVHQGDYVVTRRISFDREAYLAKMASITRQPPDRTAARPFRTAAMPSINSHSPIASSKVVGSGLRQVFAAPGGGRYSSMLRRERSQPIGIS